MFIVNKGKGVFKGIITSYIRFCYDGNIVLYILLGFAYNKISMLLNKLLGSPLNSR